MPESAGGARDNDEWECRACGERVAPDLITPENSPVLVVRCRVCGVRDEIPQGMVGR